ncbi:MAG TPA: helix-turn-helix transcriptional regulator [Tetragenococcus sp.]|nr:helix-turn-helix transcriptional regulator [Tetragenococcus sp.]
MAKNYEERKVVIHIHELLQKHQMTLSQLALDADIDKSKLSRLANGKRESLYLPYIIRLAETLDIDDINEIISIERVDEKSTGN